MELIEVLKNPSHEEYESMKEWSGNWKTEVFDHKKVKFDDPHTRWEKAFLKPENEVEKSR